MPRKLKLGKPFETQTTTDFNKFLKEFQGEKDRGTAVLGAAYLDEALSSLIRASLVDDKKEVADLVEHPWSPLGSFNARIGAAYEMGLIDRAELADLRTIQKIRNLFAHDLHGTSFRSANIAALCQNLQLQAIGGPRAHWNKTARQKFIANTILLTARIFLQLSRTDHQSARLIDLSGPEPVSRRRNASTRRAQRS